MAETVTAQRAAEFAPYAMMCSNVYVNEQAKPYFDLPQLGWTLIGEDGAPIADFRKRPSFEGPLTGLVFNLYSHVSGDIVLAIRGTDSKMDWLVTNVAFPISLQHNSANKHYRAIKARFGARLRLVTGHSLGGGVALGMSLRYGIEALVFNSSPRVFDGAPDPNTPALRRQVWQDGEVLKKVRDRWGKMDSVITPGGSYMSDYNFHGGNAHSIYLLARGLLEQGASVNGALAPVAAGHRPPVIWPG